MASTQNLSAAHPKYTTYGCFFRFLQGRLPLSRKSKKSVLAPHWQFHRRAYQRLNLLPRSWNPMLILCLKRIFSFFHRCQRFVSRAFPESLFPAACRDISVALTNGVVYPCSIGALSSSLSSTTQSLSLLAIEKFLSRRILGVLFRTQKAISPSRSPTAWFTSASLAS